MAGEKIFPTDPITAPDPPNGRPAHRIQITHIVPMHDLVLLMAFKDNELNMTDVKFLVNRVDGLKPCTEPEQFKALLRDNPQCIADWETEIGSANPEPKPGEGTVELDLDISEEYIQELSEMTGTLGVTIPQLIRAILRFFVDPDTQDAASQWAGLALIPPPHDPE